MNYKLLSVVFLSLIFAGSAAAQANLDEVDQVLGQDTKVVFSYGPDTTCDTSCEISNDLVSEYGFEELLDQSPGTPEPQNAETNIIRIGAPTYTNSELGMDSSFSGDGGEVQIHTFENGERYAVTLRASDGEGLKSAGNLLKQLLEDDTTSYDQQEVAVVNDLEAGAGGLQEVKNEFNNPYIVHTSTVDARQRAQDLALEIGGEPIYIRDVTQQTVEERNLIITSRSAYNPAFVGSSQALNPLADEPDVWVGEDWENFDGVRFHYLKDFFNPGKDVLIAAGDVQSRTDHGATFLKEVWNGNHQDLWQGNELTLEHLPRKLTVESAPESVQTGESFLMEIGVKEDADVPELDVEITQDGENLAEEYVQVDQSGDTVDLEIQRGGNYTVEVTGPEDAGFMSYRSAETEISVERQVERYDLKVDVEPEEIHPDDTVTLTPEVDGEKTEATLYIDDERIGTDNEFERTVQKSAPGELQITVSKEDRTTPSTIQRYDEHQETVAVEQRNLLESVTHFFTSLF